MIEKRRRFSPRGNPEVVDIETGDGWRLRADVREPPWRTKRRGTVVLAHTLGASRADFEAADFSRSLAAAGWRTVAFDFRGHGESRRDGLERDDTAWRYDDLVARDLPSVVASARGRNRPKDGPVVVLGHSVGGHAALASQAVGALGADAIVALAACPWVRELEPSVVRWMVKRTAMRVLDEAIDRTGDISLKALRAVPGGVGGTGDAGAAYFGHVSRAAREGAWESDDRKTDYLASLANLRVPVLGIASRGDRFASTPECVAELVKRCGVRGEAKVVERGDRGGPAPGHRALVTGNVAAAVATIVNRWLEETLNRESA